LNIVFGVFYIALGLYALIRYKESAAAGARWHQRAAKVLPWLYWFPGSKEAAGSERVWRFITPLMGVLFIVGGILLITVGWHT
jgi:uncharacterized membrane protein YgdD (TMEM256/DUF423 family)